MYWKVKTEKPSEPWNTLYNSVQSTYIGLEWWKNLFKMLDEHTEGCRNDYKFLELYVLILFFYA